MVCVAEHRGPPAFFGSFVRIALGKTPDRLDIVPQDIGPTPPTRRVRLSSRRPERTLPTTHANGTIEANSLDTCRLHLSHFARVLGEGFPLGELRWRRCG
jgi:hypothetical protein